VDHLKSSGLVSQPNHRYSDKPFIAIWEATRACDLACVHCRASAEPKPYPGELNTDQALDLIRQISDWKVPLFVITGGDPLKREDLPALIQECHKRQLTFALAPSVTPLLTLEKLKELQACGLNRLSLSLDGADSQTHDTFRGIPGTFARCLEAMQWTKDLGLKLQVNTTVSRHNHLQIWDIARLMKDFNIERWSVFFLVPTGRADKKQALSAGESEVVLNQLFDILKEGWFDIKTTEAHHFRRIILQRSGIKPQDLQQAMKNSPQPGLIRAALGVNDGRGFVFISHTGDICPSGFLPIPGGNIKKERLAEVYQHNDMFKLLRDSDALKGKCGHCEYRYHCGGSRARAFALSGDMMGADPFCSFQPTDS
jgi:AdoMet-dependent heme synthase